MYVHIQQAGYDSSLFHFISFKHLFIYISENLPNPTKTALYEKKPVGELFWEVKGSDTEVDTEVTGTARFLSKYVKSLLVAFKT
ncbi:hypothetical protein [Falsibacillus pallidus]|uniref:hypothetical protein n=1 Tax=Falsibacillus pallidus TaxID=493781 RepID=UPI003D958ED4